ncbi:hypothetical protein BLA29_005797 [Euroglyphus maynei]|uniref:Uncharacterized protein n=1 Tax=Euroglyphus maynei TaxID=6958 RepID=A0A1Y3BHW0_EURMA|nr:hypothetical protein BLA29_005797 [Euroglyphus maynei]
MSSISRTICESFSWRRYGINWEMFRRKCRYATIVGQSRLLTLTMSPNGNGTVSMARICWLVLRGLATTTMRNMAWMAAKLD